MSTEPKLTQKDIQNMADDVLAVAGTDDEGAHSREDHMFEAFVRNLANDNMRGGRVPLFIQRAAKLVMSTKNADFRRHCA